MVFVRTRVDAQNLQSFLKSQGIFNLFLSHSNLGGPMSREYSILVLHSGIPQNKRRKNLEEFKNGEVRFLVCTDVAARGIDIDSLPFVLSMPTFQIHLSSYTRSYLTR